MTDRAGESPLNSAPKTVHRDTHASSSSACWSSALLLSASECTDASFDQGDHPKDQEGGGDDGGEVDQGHSLLFLSASGLIGVDYHGDNPCQEEKRARPKIFEEIAKPACLHRDSRCDNLPQVMMRPGNYILRGIPDSLWSRFRSRAESEGVSMRALILLLIEAYVEGRIDLSMRQRGRGR